MVEEFRTWAPVILASLVALPIAALIVVGIATWRTGSGARPGRAWRMAVAEVGSIVGTLPWIWMILTPRPAPSSVELIPTRGLAEIAAGDHSTAVVQVGGNLLVFAAFGFLAPIRWPLGPLAIAVYAATGSITVEALQYGLNLGRVASVDDVVLNTLGAVIAALASWRYWHRHTAKDHGQVASNYGPGRRPCPRPTGASSCANTAGVGRPRRMKVG
jgi:hypothetical protein